MRMKGKYLTGRVSNQQQRMARGGIEWPLEVVLWELGPTPRCDDQNKFTISRVSLHATQPS